MVKQKFIELCSKKGVSPSAACKNIGISAAAFSQWRDETVPRKITLQRAAEYFGVSVDYLLGKEEQTKISPAIRLSAHELNVIHAYRSHPEMQSAVNRILGIEEEQITVYRAAYQPQKTDGTHEAVIQMEQKRWEEMANTPKTDEDLL